MDLASPNSHWRHLRSRISLASTPSIPSNKSNICQQVAHPQRPNRRRQKIPPETHLIQKCRRILRRRPNNRHDGDDQRARESPRVRHRLPGLLQRHRSPPHGDRLHHVDDPESVRQCVYGLLDVFLRAGGLADCRCI
jgi:hypothetical protein